MERRKKRNERKYRIKTEETKREETAMRRIEWKKEIMLMHRIKEWGKQNESGRGGKGG